MHAVVVRKCKDVKSQLESKIYKTLQLVRLAQTFCALLLAMLPKAVLLPFVIYS